MTTREPVLAFDVSTTACSAAVLRDGRLVAHRSEAMERGQAERLNPMIADAMAEAGLVFGALARVATTIGPGAFTGIRIGIACARAIALAAGVEAVGVTTFDALARAVPVDERAGRRLLVCVNGKRRDVFAQEFGADLRPVGAAFALLPEAAGAALAHGRHLLAGDGAPQVFAALAGSADAGTGAACRIRLSAAVRPPDAAHVAALAAAIGTGPEALRPYYIRPPDVRLPGAVPQG